MPFIGVASPYADRWYFDQVLEGVTSAARDHGAEVRVSVHRPGPQAHHDVTEHFALLFEDPGCVGAVAVSFDLSAEEAALLGRSGRPVVAVGRSLGLPAVFIDDIAAARLATEHLLSLGHTSIVHLAGYATAPDDFAMRGDRVRGYSDAMHAAGLDEVSQVVPSMFSSEDAFRVAHQLLAADDRPTAVFAVADEVAFAVLDAAEDLGLDVPLDLSVIGVDDHPDAERRGLTTMRQEPRSLGRAAVARLVGETRDDAQRQDVELVVRSSTGVRRSATPPQPIGAFRRLLGGRDRGGR